MTVKVLTLILFCTDVWTTETVIHETSTAVSLPDIVPTNVLPTYVYAIIATLVVVIVVLVLLLVIRQLKAGMTQALLELNLSSFDTLLLNSSARFLRRWRNCNNDVVKHLSAVLN